jgi:glycosyltransferase involved in cell wall biosynthesis
MSITDIVLENVATDRQARNFISVVTVVYNRVSEIEATIASITSQTLQNFEYLIIDGGSTDGTVDIIKKYNDKITYWVSEPDKGIYDAMNKGAQRAKGEWIIFMNAGDRFYDSRVLASCAPTLANSPNRTIVYGDAEIVGITHPHIQHQKDRHLDLTKSIIHQSIFTRTTFLQSNPYNTRYKVMADYDNLLSVSVVTPDKCLHIPEVICRYDKTGISSRPLYTYIREYYAIARRRMRAKDFISFNLYILPRLIWSFRLALT